MSGGPGESDPRPTYALNIGGDVNCDSNVDNSLTCISITGSITSTNGDGIVVSNIYASGYNGISVSNIL